jgi:hypothetical protein
VRLIAAKTPEPMNPTVGKPHDGNDERDRPDEDARSGLDAIYHGATSFDQAKAYPGGQLHTSLRQELGDDWTGHYTAPHGQPSKPSSALLALS